MKTIERLTRNAWFEIGLQLLAAEGEKALTIDRLCQTAERTKGSFYHHFKSHDEFVTALLAYWQFEYTNRIIARVEQLEDLSDRRRELDRLAASVDSRLERAIRRWSGVDERVQLTLKQVDEQRIQYLAKLICELGQSDEETAHELAVIEYAAFVGFQQLFPEAESQWIERLIHRVTQLISSGK
ncbi:TetR/AcrR family transcriptional regulator [Leptolyngbya sp. 7M]|uniref:TetR/AcrR family transcriptional regulator n=1 Tax=Leptolyngbya sp. 7M TaxID=2812896 RepID=UPI001B8D2394|nr:TetR/AcrR family transcriptional regulator [Leptolyngbya sp. 7M]QYO63118.1 TetR/AcrR family transcriptional regulator [Leptolyngbya sp. 7M]